MDNRIWQTQRQEYVLIACRCESRFVLGELGPQVTQASRGAFTAAFPTDEKRRGVGPLSLLGPSIFPLSPKSPEWARRLVVVAVVTPVHHQWCCLWHMLSVRKHEHLLRSYQARAPGGQKITNSELRNAYSSSL